MNTNIEVMRELDATTFDKWHLRFLRLAREVADALEAALHKENKA